MGSRGPNGEEVVGKTDMDPDVDDKCSINAVVVRNEYCNDLEDRVPVPVRIEASYQTPPQLLCCPNFVCVCWLQGKACKR